ncbi:MAG: glycerol-3-phosphate 1-O-acyltransferase PlsY [Nitrosomonas sp.]|nr:glycerol-3-phosphate 1-O-acyltransferase PlsY [Nitrosomonas sp.]
MLTALLILTAYILGSVPFAVVTSWIFKLPDPRSYGSGNPGATNVLRTGQKGAAILTLAGDAGKGWLAIVLARYFTTPGEEGAILIAGMMLAVFIGHLYPIFLKFRGGKGVATAAGVLLGLNPWLGLITALTWIIVALLSRFSSLAALSSALLAPLYTYWLLQDSILTTTTLIISTLLIIRHRSNITNLLAGKETRIGK